MRKDTRITFWCLALCLILCSHSVKAGIGSSICPAAPPIDEPCVEIDSWTTLKSYIGSAQSELILCPFDITKDVTDGSAEIPRGLSIRCKRNVATEACIIRGGGSAAVQLLISSVSDTVIQGLIFIGSTSHAIHIQSPSPTVSHKICDCSFISNKLLDPVSTGVVLTEKDSGIVHVVNCLFYDNYSTFGGAIYSQSNLFNIVGSSFYENRSNSMGAAIFSARYSSLAISACIFRRNLDSDNIAIVIKAVEKGDGVWFDGGDNVSMDNGSCDGVYNPAADSCAHFDDYQPLPTPLPTPAKQPISPFRPDDLTVFDRDTGLHLATGLSVKQLAKTGERVLLDNGQRSANPFHAQPDGATIVAKPDGGWLYVGNSELSQGEGGVYVVDFDSLGNILDYRVLLQNTSRNCNGGLTPWQTWVSCEEHATGQCWQVDPFGRRAPEPTLLGGPDGGNFEAFAYDDRDPDNPAYFITEDHERGALRRFRPSQHHQNDPWLDLHDAQGTHDYLRFIPNTNRFEWTESLELGRQSAEDFYPNSEGITHRNGVLFFVSKKTKFLYMLNLDTMIYQTEKTSSAPMTGTAEFRQEADHLLMLSDDVLYMTEDGGSSPGVYGRDMATGRYFALMEARLDRFDGDEATGIAFNPDWTIMYVCLQDMGTLYEIRRANGQPFENRDRRLQILKLHTRPSRH